MLTGAFWFFIPRYLWKNFRFVFPKRDRMTNPKFSCLKNVSGRMRTQFEWHQCTNANHKQPMWYTFRNWVLWGWKLFRFARWATRGYIKEKCRETYSMFFNWSYTNRPAGRPTERVSGIYARLLKKECFYLFRNGWEVRWYNFFISWGTSVLRLEVIRLGFFKRLTSFDCPVNCCKMIQIRRIRKF